MLSKFIGRNSFPKEIVIVGTAVLFTLAVGIKIYKELKIQDVDISEEQIDAALSSLILVEKELKVPQGLINHGNTCYINSVLQSIVSSQRMVSYLQKLGTLVQNNNYTVENLHQSKNILLSLIKVVSNLLNDTQTVDPRILIESLEEKSQFFHFKQQQDSHELLNMLLEHMEELYECQKEPSLKSQGENIQQNPIKGRIKSYIYCGACQYNYMINIESTFVISLDIRYHYITSLQQAIDRYFKEEQVEGFTCVKCSLLKLNRSLSSSNVLDSLLKSSTLDFYEAKKKLESCNIVLNPVQRSVLKITDQSIPLPEIFVFHFKRITIDTSGNTIKLQKHIEFPIIYTRNQAQYQLTSVIEHFGEEHYGHYVAYRRVQNNLSHKWFYISDSSVREVEESVVLKSQPYILFYDLL